MPDHLEKPKRTSDGSLKPLDALLVFMGFRPTLFQFETEASLDLCVKHLKTTENKRDIFGYLMNQPSIELRLYQEDETTYRYYIRGQHGRRPWISIDGHLGQQADGVILMTGAATTEYSSWEWVFAFVLITVVFLTFGSVLRAIFPGITPAIVLFLISIPIGNVALAASDRQKFIYFVEETISFGRVQGYRKKKNI